MASRRVLLTALVVLLGMQALRTSMPLLVFIFRDRFGWNVVAVGALAFAVYATGFLAAPLYRALGPRGLLVLGAGGLGLARLALQLWTGEPLVDCALALAATICFFLVVPALSAGRGADPAAGFSVALGWVLGLAADTALHGVYGTWDMSWRDDLGTAAVILALVVALGWLVATGAPEAGEGAAPGDVPLRLAMSWVAIGPFLFLELLVAGNVGRLAALSGWSVESAALWTVAGQVLAVAAVIRLARWRRPSWRLVAQLAFALLVGSLLIAWPTGASAALWLLATQLAAAVLLAIVLVAISASPALAGLKRLSLGHGLGLSTLAAFFFVYYGAVDLRLPFSKDVLPPIAGVVLGLTAIAAARSMPHLPAAERPAGRWWLAAAALVALPLAKLLAAPPLRTAHGEGLPVRLLTYNLHCSIDPRGHLGLEAIAIAIEAQRPDVVALQEVSRGWVVSGSVDTLGWLSRRLAMPFVFAPTADPLWGNAVLSRRPIVDHRAFALPTEDLLIRRGAVSARVDLAADGQLEVIATHYHHPRGGGAVRVLQSRAILDFWQGRARTALLGDLNAAPGEPEIEMLRAAGLADVLDSAGVEPGFTHPAPAPERRIDYIWISPDLAASDVVVAADQASDHLPVAATLDARFHRP